MTHDELLEKIAEIANDSPITDSKHPTYLALEALRAVVELHKPWSAGNGDASVPPVTYTPKCLYCNRIYPCETIQAIEKELR